MSIVVVGHSHPLKLCPGSLHSRNDPGMWLFMLLLFIVIIIKWSTCDYESIEGSFAYIWQKKSGCPFRGKRSQKGKKVHKFYLRPESYLHYYFHANWALLEDFEIFAHFDHIFTLLFRTFRPLKVGMTPLGQKFELPIK